MPAWRVYYADGSSCDDSTPRAALPKFGVVSIAFADETGRCTAERGDVYILHRDGTWTPHDHIGLAQILTQQLADVDLVLYGLQVTDKVWSRVHGQSVTDPDFGVVLDQVLVGTSAGRKILLEHQADGSWRGFEL